MLFRSPPGDEEEEETVNVVHSQGNTRMVVLSAKDDNEDDDDMTMTGPEEMKRLESAATQVVDEQTEDMMAQNIVDMATAVAMEMEDKRRTEEWEKMKTEQKKQELMKIQSEADALAREAERSELSIDELTTLRQLEAKLGISQGQSQGPQIPTAGAGQRQALDAY